MKDLLVAGESLLILGKKLLRLVGVTRRGIMMKRPSQNMDAEMIPIGPAVSQVKMPGLVNGFGGSDRHRRGHPKKQKFFILFNDPVRIRL